MKKYKRRIPLITPSKLIIISLYSFFGAVVVFFLCGDINYWTILCASLFFISFILWVFVILSVNSQYSYGENCFVFSYLGIDYKMIAYTEINTIIICNAAYNNGYGYGIYGNVPMTFKAKNEKQPLPFITLHQNSRILSSVHSGMFSREICFLDDSNSICLGICWSDTLLELIIHTTAEVYILEDVFLRFKSGFYKIIRDNPHYENRFHVLSDHITSINQFILDNNFVNASSLPDSKE